VIIVRDVELFKIWRDPMTTYADIYIRIFFCRSNQRKVNPRKLNRVIRLVFFAVIFYFWHMPFFCNTSEKQFDIYCNWVSVCFQMKCKSTAFIPTNISLEMILLSKVIIKKYFRLQMFLCYAREFVIYLDIYSSQDNSILWII
jgi:hypothetical protein